MDMITTLDDFEREDVAVELAHMICPYGDIEQGVRNSPPTETTGLVEYIWQVARFNDQNGSRMPLRLKMNMERWARKQKGIPTKTQYDRYILDCTAKKLANNVMDIIGIEYSDNVRNTALHT